MHAIIVDRSYIY